MRTHLTYICIISALLFFGWMGFKTLQKSREENRRLSGNVHALRQDTTEKAAVLILKESELKDLYRDRYDLIRQYEKAKGGKVREVHTVEYRAGSVQYDTLIIYDTPPCWGDSLFFTFNHGCVTSEVVYDMNTGIAKDTLFGSISIERYVLAERPRWVILKPRYWKKENWPTSVRVENNCGLQIKENTIFEIH